MGRLGVRGHSASSSGQRCAVTSSERPNAIDNASFTADRQNRDRDDVSYYIGHLLRLAWRAAANLLLISLAIGPEGCEPLLLISISGFPHVVNNH